MLHFLMLPANAVCDRVGLINEHERGMMRMLVNMLLCSALAVIAVLSAGRFWRDRRCLIGADDHLCPGRRIQPKGPHAGRNLDHGGRATRERARH